MRTCVALFVFNRPEATARVFDAIRAARPPQLLIVADGPRPNRPGDVDLVEGTRVLVADVDWACDVSRLYAHENMGCGARLASGLDWVFDMVDEAIVLEDDCLPHPAFFRFSEAMLVRFRDDERIGMVSGTNYFSDATRRESYFLTNYFAVWGWASWARVWRSYDRAMLHWPVMRARDDLRGIYRHPGMARYVSSLFDAVQRGDVDTWDIQWFYSCLAQGRRCVVPRVNLVSNIGYSGSRAPGPNVGMVTTDLDTEHLVHPATMLPDLAYEDRLYEERLRNPPRRLVSRVRDKVTHVTGRRRR